MANSPLVLLTNTAFLCSSLFCATPNDKQLLLCSSLVVPTIQKASYPTRLEASDLIRGSDCRINSTRLPLVTKCGHVCQLSLRVSCKSLSLAVGSSTPWSPVPGVRCPTLCAYIILIECLLSLLYLTKTDLNPCLHDLLLRIKLPPLRICATP